MNVVRIRPRSSIADPERARAAVVDLPTPHALERLQTPGALLSAIASIRVAAGAERRREPVIVLSLVPVAARRR
jgi:hypothetical protein